MPNKVDLTSKVDPPYDDLPEERYHSRAPTGTRRGPRSATGSSTTSPTASAPTCPAAEGASRIPQRRRAELHLPLDVRPRGLISIDDDYSLLFKRNAVPGNVLSLVNPDGRLRVPEQELYRPHRRFLEYHREEVFKG